MAGNWECVLEVGLVAEQRQYSVGPNPSRISSPETIDHHDSRHPEGMFTMPPNWHDTDEHTNNGAA